ncbi:MAG: hypothetical protein DRQ13_00110 [Ignavibacteriae bacterium]|nr:MAG: hypothetical protein DRQ13_00110 [Ignavibacteriota bacterium]
MKRKIKFNYKLLLLFMVVVLLSLGFLGDDKKGVSPPKPIYKGTSTLESGKNGDAYAMEINNIYLPLNRKGIIADVNIPPPEGNGSGGQFAGGTFLFSSGFFLSGNSNGQPWANAVASATLVEDYIQGTVEGGRDDPNAVMYVLNSQDEPFGQSWQDWIDAVALGADYYDGDGNGEYSPVDRNGNGKWEPDEDRPDLIGDETVWCVYSDGIVAALRRWNTVSPKGIEIRQTVFGFASAGAIGNLVFVRFRFKYVGLDPSDPEQLDEVYFGVWADPDVGDHTDDVVGVDVPRNAGYTYNNTADDVYGNQVPCFMIDFFSGPRAYIPGETFIDNDGDGEYTDGVDTPLDTATSVRGQVMGITEFPGARNLPISSFVEYINGDPNLNDPSNKEEARNYMLGLTRVGDVPDPCDFSYGNGPFDGCETTDPRFWFSGDPVEGTGWLNVMNVDQRQMTNTGPFILKRDEENEIVVAYVVGRGTTPLDGITKAREIDDGAQNIFDLNFLAPSPPPPPQITLTAGDDFIDIIWETKDQMEYQNLSPTWNMMFEGYQLWAFKTDINQDIVNNQQNSLMMAIYDKSNFIENVYKENGETGGIELLYDMSPPENQLDSALYVDEETGRIRYRIFNDPFDPSIPVIKGTPYYFAVSSYALNYNSLVSRSGAGVAWADTGDYYLSAEAFAQEAENIRTISTIVVGEQLYTPPVLVQPANQVTGASTGEVGYDVLENSALQNAEYEVEFFTNTESEDYAMFWKMRNISTGTLLVDSSETYTLGETSVSQVITEGFITRVEDITTTIGQFDYQPESSVWYEPTNTELDTVFSTGVYYVGTDIPQGRAINTFGTGSSVNQSEYISADRLRKVELRFGAPNSGKAYRYINNYIGFPQRANNYTFASAITGADTVVAGGNFPIGNWDVANDRPFGFVDVPFTAWVVDERYDEEYQLAVGFVEKRTTELNPQGNPDGIWDPADSLKGSGEVIIIFDSPYDPEGGHMELSGGDFETPGGTETVWSVLLKLNFGFDEIPADAVGITDEQRAIFNSSWFNAMYVVGLQRENENAFFTEGDVYTINLDVYPYTEADLYRFSINGNTITSDDERELWENVNVYPNPLYGFNTLTSHVTSTPDEPIITFTNLPEEVTVKIYALSGTLLRTLTTEDKSSPTSPFIRWDLQNDSGLRVASGMYLAIVSNPNFGDKVLKFAIIMPQKQIQRF